MINRKIKKHLFIGLTSTLAIGSVVSTSTLLVNQENKSIGLNNVKTSLQNTTVTNAMNGAWQTNSNDVSTTTNHIIDFHKNVSSYSLDVPSQYYATDASNSSFATFTSSGNTSNGTFDQITRFITSPQKKNSDTTDNTLIYPGETAWIVKKSQLANVISVSESELTLKGMLFSDGGFGSYPSLFVLANSSSSTANKGGSYVFRIMWNAVDKQIGNDPIPKPGNYKLAQQVTNSTSDLYDLLSLESPSTSTIQVLKTPDVPNTNTSQDLTITYKTISDATFATPINYNTLSSFTYTISQSLLNSNFASSAKVKYSFRLNSDMYIFYQSKTASKSDASKQGTLVKLPLLRENKTMNITQSNIATLDLSSQFSDSSLTESSSLPLAINFTNVSATNYFMTIASNNGNSSSTGESKYVKVDFDLNTVFNTTTRQGKFTYKTQTISGSSIYFRNIQKLYGGVNDATVIGYLGIDSANRAVKLDLDLKFNKFLYAFDQASLKLGSIFFVYTKPGDSSWYGLMTTTKFVQFSENTLIGRWDALSSKATLELPINYTIKSEDQIKDSVLYQEVANTANTAYDSKFSSYLASPLSFQDFVDVTFVDPRLGAVNPEVSISSSAFKNGTNRVYSIDLTFKQKLRNLKADGSIDNSVTPTEIILFTKKYTFINAVGSITPAYDDNKGFEVPAFIKAKLPSQLTNEEIAKYLFKIENVGSYQISTIPNDLNGTLVVTMNVGYIWSQIANTYVLQANRLDTYTFGSENSPFFQNNPLFGRDASITPIDEKYVETKPQVMQSLSTKYGATLASSLSKKQAMSDFVLLGNAFMDQSSIDNSTIVLPKEENITLIPFDREGYLLIRVLFPKIGNLVNHEILFSTPKVFLVNPTAQETVYFAFKTNEQALNTVVSTSTSSGNTQKTIKDFKPSDIASQLNNIQTPQYLIQVLGYFAIFSDYFSKLALEAADSNNSQNQNAINIQATANDAAGTLEININLLNALPNSNITNFTKVFSGLKTNGTLTGLSKSEFSFKTISLDLLKLTPSQVSKEMLENSGVFEMNDSAKSLNKEISINPINTSGALEVTVTFYNWIQDASTIIPTKQFSQTFTGFVVAKPQVNSFVWKSFAEIDPQYQAMLPSTVVSTINNQLTTNSSRLLTFAKLSNSLLSYIQANENKLVLSYVVDDLNGNLSVIAKINGYTSAASVNAFETTFSGFNFTNRNFTINLEANDSFRLQALKQKIPSTISENDIASLYTIPENANLNKKIEVVQDDKAGTLSLTIQLVNPYTNEIVASSTQLYTGFTQFVPQPQDVDVVTIVLSVLVPLVVLSIPIIFLGLFKNRNLIKSTAKKLDKRLKEIEKKSKSDRSL